MNYCDILRHLKIELQYIEKSVEKGTRQQIGNKSGHGVYVLTLQQKMTHGKVW